MGMFDTVKMTCPDCGGKAVAQTKRHDRRLNIYDLEAPDKLKTTERGEEEIKDIDPKEKLKFLTIIANNDYTLGDGLTCQQCGIEWCFEDIKQSEGINLHRIAKNTIEQVFQADWRNEL